MVSDPGQGWGTSWSGDETERTPQAEAASSAVQQGMGGLLVSSDLLPTPPACTSYPSGMLERGHLPHEPHLCLIQALVQVFMLPPAFPELQETVLQHLRVGILFSSPPCPLCSPTPEGWNPVSPPCPLSRGQSPLHWCSLR